MNFVITLSKLLWILLNPSTHLTVTLIQNLSSDALRLVFTSDGVGVVVGVIRELMT